ncbi:MAG: hypothetical protein JW874_10565 [Spirochaetales bacterium]|nr:hypothetical protein [Spirochaetales bacterium]
MKACLSRCLIVIFLLCSAVQVCADECVILLHGLARHAHSLKPVARRLEKEGYEVYNIGYPSTKYPIERLAVEFVAQEIGQIIPHYDKVYFVTHSMGGIMLRYLVMHGLARCDKAVMLCPPNQGSSLVVALEKHLNWLFKVVNGPAGRQLAPGSEGIVTGLSVLEDSDIGIIAGSKSVEPLFSHWIPGPDDGKVAISETVLPGMDDFIIMHHTHTFIMNCRDTQDQIVLFLRTGAFAHTQ